MLLQSRSDECLLQNTQFVPPQKKKKIDAYLLHELHR